MPPPSLKAAAAYRSVGLETRAPQHDQHQLVVMMYETVLECLAMARGAIEKNDTPTKIKQLNKAIRIVQEGLLTSLDLDNGGELAANLSALYDYCVLRMTQANAANDAAALAEVAGLIRPLADAWKQLRSGPPAADASAPAASASPATPTVATPPGQGKVLRQLGGMYGAASNAPRGGMLVGA